MITCTNSSLDLLVSRQQLVSVAELGDDALTLYRLSRGFYKQDTFSCRMVVKGFHTIYLEANLEDRAFPPFANSSAPGPSAGSTI